MSYFSRLAFDLMQMLDNGQKFQAQQRLFSEGCKNPNPQLRGLEKIANDHKSRLRIRKYQSRSRKQETKQERLEEIAKMFGTKL